MQKKPKFNDQLSNSATQIIQKLEATRRKSSGIVINCQSSWRKSSDRQGVNLVLF
ncbi:hypothetical protein [Laspinema olomoucense]|uniref:Uncharacterized protein n=1 Tax=Laspinema olomoucense D3b TaxID=2953688 RepID=A0ABT2N483_9CYAN|nr:MULTISPECIES: hypothetical protein [unclassified Laspinema]MCT7977281.1 hypothetical protein [Laspinema sp. D3b]MCT7989927.1 hypothetical protein [Laspinema sp. D3a]MCT7995513.1 hypothetical protein [Laspinema sp. D3c]